MKKIYFAPETKTVKIATVRMIAESFGKNGANATMSDPGNSLSRHGNSSWDDEE